MLERSFLEWILLGVIIATMKALLLAKLFRWRYLPMPHEMAMRILRKMVTYFSAFGVLLIIPLFIDIFPRRFVIIEVIVNILITYSICLLIFLIKEPRKPNGEDAKKRDVLAALRKKI